MLGYAMEISLLIGLILGIIFYPVVAELCWRLGNWRFWRNPKNLADDVKWLAGERSSSERSEREAKP